MGFSWIMERIVDIADQYSNGPQTVRPLIPMIESGYSLLRLPEHAKNHGQIL